VAHQICHVDFPQKNDAWEVDDQIRQFRSRFPHRIVSRDKYFQSGVVRTDSKHAGSATVKYHSLFIHVLTSRLLVSSSRPFDIQLCVEHIHRPFAYLPTSSSTKRQ
jgi:hypothetical protein